MIYASTMSVYGVKPEHPVKEDETTFPQSFYGVGKLASEHYLRIYEQYGINSTAIRLFNVYGPGQNMANLRQGMVSIFMAQMLKDNKIHIKGSGDRFRDLIYIDDVIDAFLATLDNPDSVGKALNIGTGVKTTVNELLDVMIQLHGSEVKCHFEGATAGDIHGIYADISLARECLGFSPKYSLNEGLKKMYEWAANNK
jgi:UDP-glucose 4-epimerase